MRPTRVTRMLLTALLGAALAAGAAGSAASADPACAANWWPQPRQSSCGNGSAVNAQAPSAANVARLELAWKFRPGRLTRAHPPSFPQPIVYAGSVMPAPYVYIAAASGKNRVYALDLDTGEVRWASKIGNGQMLVADRDALLLSRFDQLWRYAAQSGDLVWGRTVALGSWGTPVISDGTWYAFGGGDVVALDARTAEPRWNRTFSCDLNCDLAAAAGRVFVSGVAIPLGPEPPGSHDGLYALDARTGATLWSARTTADYSAGATPVVAGGRVFVRTIAGGYGRRVESIEAFRAKDGKHLWHASVGVSRGIWFTPPAADTSVVVYPSDDGFLYALDAATGAQRWRARVGLTGTKAAVVNGLVWAGDDERRLVALDAGNGRMLWRSEQFRLGLQGRPPETGALWPVVAGPYVLVQTAVDGLRAYRVPSP